MNISKEFNFEASHILPRHEGKCSRLHGHSWRVVISMSGVPDADTRFVMDYAIIKRFVQPLVDLLDHRHLNDLIPYPSSENVCLWLAHRLRFMWEPYGDRWPMYSGGMIIRVSETFKTWANWDSSLVEDLQAVNGDLVKGEVLYGSNHIADGISTSQRTVERSRTQDAAAEAYNTLDSLLKIHGFGS